MSRLSAVQQHAVTDLLRIFPVADDLGRMFADAGCALHLVGGSVRDALLGRLGDDLDFATDATPQQVLGITEGWAEGSWTTGIDFGTVGIMRGGLRCEITTFRAEAYDPTSRNPQVVFGDSLVGDLSRRDFTINTMALSLPDHAFVDPYDGLSDLASRTLSTPTTAAASFSDDPLRMMRAARFVSQLGFTPDADVVEAMQRMADRIAIVSVERVRDELFKLLLGADPRRGLELVVDTGLAEHVLPEIPDLRLEIDPLHHHKDVYLHSLAVLQNAIALEDSGPDLTLRMAALLHDIGKPATRELGPRGQVTFHHHEVKGAKMTRSRLRALRCPKAFVDDVARLVELHLRFHGFNSGEWTDSAVRRYVTDAGPLLDRLNKLVRSDCTTRNPRKAAALAAAYAELERRIAVLAAEEELAAIRPDLDGSEIMELLGVPAGPVVGQAYRHLLAVRMDRGPLPREIAEAELLRWAEEQGIAAARPVADTTE
ncbi:MAG TPA: CCA tRNA nucleotidyltransferase [Mycobacteriales bacterium]|nr:CCA tRNA nucleotidyltransferase [Mycobacteriales bacterium]